MRRWTSSFLSGRSGREAGLHLIWWGNPNAPLFWGAWVPVGEHLPCPPALCRSRCAAPPAGVFGNSRTSGSLRCGALSGFSPVRLFVTARTGPGSCVHGILQERRLEWVDISFSRESSQSRDRMHLS